MTGPLVAQGMLPKHGREQVRDIEGGWRVDGEPTLPSFAGVAMHLPCVLVHHAHPGDGDGPTWLEPVGGIPP